MSLSKNNEITVLPSALDLRVEVVALDPIESIGGKEVDFDILVF